MIDVVLPVKGYLELSARLIREGRGVIRSVKAYSDIAGQKFEVLQAYEDPDRPGSYVLELEDNETRLSGPNLVVDVEYEMFSSHDLLM